MRTVLLSVVVLTLAATAARAHFVWILPSGTDAKPGVQVVFSDSLAPDDPKYLDKIKQTELFVIAPNKKPTALKMTQGKEAWEAALEGKELQAVAGRCDYGVTSRAGSEFALRYYAKSIILPAKLDSREGLTKQMQGLTSDQLALDIVPIENGVQVLWQGKPLADAEVVLIGDGEGEAVNRKTDKNGEATFSKEDVQKAGVKELVGVRAKYVEAKEGNQDGKAYKEIRHYATLTVRHKK